MATVELTDHLSLYFPALEGKSFDVEADTVREVVDAMEARAPGFAFYICDEAGRLRQHVNIFVGEDRVKDRHALTDPVGTGSRVLILQALSGG